MDLINSDLGLRCSSVPSAGSAECCMAVVWAGLFVAVMRGQHPVWSNCTRNLRNRCRRVFQFAYVEFGGSLRKMEWKGQIYRRQKA
jgi:hypothetical protein